nr:hypothetical protein [uncultured Cohaesibacter sp.]
MPELIEIHGYKWLKEDEGLIQADVTIEFEDGSLERVPFVYQEGGTGKGAEAIAKDLRDNSPSIAPADPIEAPLPTQDDYTKAIQALLDNAAIARRYDSAATMATYTNSTNSDWSAEATAMVAWRDAVWLYAYQQLDVVLAGEREQPTIEELLAELPEPNWPA